MMILIFSVSLYDFGGFFVLVNISALPLKNKVDYDYDYECLCILFCFHGGHRTASSHLLELLMLVNGMSLPGHLYPGAGLTVLNPHVNVPGHGWPY